MNVSANPEQTTLRKFLDFTAEKYGARPCIRWRKNGEIITKTYTRLRDDSLLAASLLYNFCGRQRTHTVIIGKTSYRYLCFLNGIFMSGSVAVPLPENASPEEIAELTHRSDAQILLCDNTSAPAVQRAFENAERSPAILNMEEAVFPETPDDFPDAVPEDCALIMFTSGTTGEKKGVMLSSLALLSNVFFKEMSYEGNHTALNVLPMHHIFSFSCDYLKNLKDGVTICLAGEPAELYESFLLFEPTVVRLVPMITDGLLRKIRIARRRNPELSPREAAEKVFGRNLRSIISSGARLSPAAGAAFEEVGVSVRQGYGMTETGPRIAVPDGETDAASAGKIISICEARIRDGELQIKSPSLMSGYYKMPEETAAVFTEDGWFRTGDTARITEKRHLYITGRIKNLIILSNGENVSPEEIEQKLSICPVIKEALVYGENDRITAEIFPDPEQTGDDIPEAVERAVRQYNAGAPSEKAIAKTIIRNAPFEKTPSGKIKRTQIHFDGGKQ